MKKNGILNADISRVLSYMGHTDTLCIGDCGLPIPESTERIDLALSFGNPTFIDVLKEVLKDMKVEKIILAEEIKDKNPEQLKNILDLLKNVEVEYVSHTKLKLLSGSCKAVVRSGETTPYSNIILQSGCIF